MIVLKIMALFVLENIDISHSIPLIVFVFLQIYR